MNNLEKTTKIKTFLSKLELSPKEIQAYMYLVKNGPQHITQLARACSITRTNGYDVVKKLETKGLCFNLGSLYGRKVKANSPSEIKSLIETKIKEASGLKDEFNQITQLFSQIEVQQKNPKTEVAYFEGRESVRKLLLRTLQSSNDEIMIAGSEIDLIEALGETFMSDWNEKRKSKNIFLHALRPGNKRGEGEVFTNDAKYLREVRIRPENKIRLKSILVLFGSKIAFITVKEDIFGTHIDNQMLAIMLTSWFEVIWESSKKV